MASAILTILYPEDFTIYDVRVCDVLGDFHNINNKASFENQWFSYTQFLAAVKNLVLKICRYATETAGSGASRSPNSCLKTSRIPFRIAETADRSWGQRGAFRHDVKGEHARHPAIQLHQLQDERFQLRHQIFHSGRFGNQPWNIITVRYPDVSLVIPDGANLKYGHVAPLQPPQ